MSKPIFILGAGGHAKVLVASLQACGENVSGILETDTKRVGNELLGVKIFEQDAKLREYQADEILLVNGIGSIGIPGLRAQIFTQFKQKGYRFLAVIHPTAFVAIDVKLGEGVQIMAGAIIQPGCNIGDNVIINTRASVDHDCYIRNHTHIAPGVTLSGDVIVEENCHIGTGASVIQGVKLGRSALVAAGSVVIDHVAEGNKVAGVPARVMEYSCPTGNKTGQVY